MFAWIASNIGTILITLVLVVIVAAIIHSLHQNHCAGRTSCGSNCAHCAMSGSCHSTKK